MKIAKLLLPALLFLTLNEVAVAQSPKENARKKDTTIKLIEIDPRQYITVTYNRFRTRERMDTVWSWENRAHVPNQKYNALDIAGEIKIEFDKIGLIRNTDFFGNITLEAEISGSKGTRPIEVNPYSEVGVARKAIGIKSDPPYDVSNKLLSMLVELSDVEPVRDSLRSTYSFNVRNALQQFGNMIALCSNECDAAVPGIDVIKKQILEATENFDNVAGNSAYFGQPWLPGAIKDVTDRQKLKGFIEDLKKTNNYNYSIQSRDNFVKSYQAAAGYLQDKVPLILEFLNSFEKGGQEGLKAFLSLTSLSLIKYNDIKNSLIKYSDTLRKLQLPGVDTKGFLTDSLLLIYKEPIYKSVNSLYYLARLQGSEIERIILAYANKLKGSNASLDSLYTFSPNQVKGRQQVITDIINTYKDTLSILIARKAGEQIYKKLIKATIDLGKNGAAEGETLTLYLTWILDGADSLQNSPRLEIGKYQLTHSGWALEISDMFSLVNRVRPSSTIDPTHESPSIFKGAGGAVLMWSYSREDKGLNIKQNEEGFYTKRKNVLMNFFQPSIGLNVSYLDFNTSKDVEVGTGLQIGLFHNKIYFGYGVNLNLVSPKDAPYYFFLGFSFAKISDLFKDAGKISSSN